VNVFTVIDHYLPAYKHGGPVRTMAAMVRQLPEVSFWIFTRDHDLGEAEPFPGVVPDRWEPAHGAQVWYASRGAVGVRDLARALRTAGPDVAYVNSLFSRLTLRYLIGRRLGLVPSRLPLVLAPRGELSPGALGLKPRRKRAFLRAGAATGLFAGVTWQASTELERGEMGAALEDAGVRAPRIAVAKDLFELRSPERSRDKPAGAARFVFVSRISPKKNLLQAIRCLAPVRDRATLHVYGPIEDRDYWARCEALAASLGVNARHEGAVAPEDVPGVFASHDYFLFPTLGENFGHVIVEALAAGCPVLLSDRTPWSGVAERGAGWTVPLDDAEGWRGAVVAAVDATPARHREMAAAARSAAVTLGGLAEARVETLRMLEGAAAR
jgi:glycosyltransferase involved in cell wall biosynthesis